MAAKEGGSSSEDKNNLDLWMIRPCHAYKDEYNECVSLKGRFHQYFIHGEPIDCNGWKKDYITCQRWESKKETKDAEQLLESERERRHQRLLPHYTNDVWKFRKRPPKDWNKPLPDWLQQQYENSYLQVKANEIKMSGLVENEVRENKSFCVIS